MESVWWRAIQDAGAAGFLTTPATVDGFSNSGGEVSTTCDKTYGSGNSVGVVQTQRGSGTDDGNYVHVSSSIGSVLILTRDEEASFLFAKLFSSAADDILEWTEGGYYYIYRNGGGKAWTRLSDSIDVLDG